MSTFKNIRVPVGKSGKTRLQRVQVLKSGKFKFVKNIKKGKSSVSRAKKSPSKRKRKARSTSKRARPRKMAKGFLKGMSAAGAAEDLAWGFVGLKLIGATPTALPSIRVIQGAAGHMLNRRGKSRLIPALIDLVDLWLAGATGGQVPLVTEVQQLLKLSPVG